MTGERAVSTTISYVLTLSITTVLVAGLLIAGGGFVDDQRESASHSELRVLGQQLAGDIAAADRLSATAGADGDLVLQRSFPDRIAGSGYRVNVSRIGASDTYAIRLETSTPEVSDEVRVYSTKPVFMKSNLTGGTTAVEYNSVTETLLVKRPGPYVFQEESEEVVIEAESYPEDQPGAGEWSTHYWKSFENDSASGGEAVTTYPNESTSGGAGETTDGTRLDYEVDFESGGQYYVWVRMRAPSADAGDSDSIHIGVEGASEPASFDGDSNSQGLSEGASTSWTWVHGVGNDGDSDDYVQIDTGSGGVKTLHVWMREDGAQIDKIVIRKTQTDPSGTGPEESEWG